MIEFGEVRVGDIAKAHMKEVLDSNWISGGPKVEQFEKEWSELFSYGSSVAVSSGTDACINACLTLYDLVGAKRGDEVITPSLSFIATANAIRAAGFTPKFVDVKRETLNIDETKIEEAITDKTKAIMVVHTMGRPCEMNSIMDIANKHNLMVIEDACEAHGARYQGEYIGHFGHISCFSFYIAHLICCGEGGMLSTNDLEIAKILKSVRSHGRPFGSNYFNHERIGLNSKMNDMEAAIGLEGIKNFTDTFIRRHRTISKFRAMCEYLTEFSPFYYSEEDISNVNCPHGFSITCKREGDVEVVKNIFDKYNIHWKRNFGSIPTQHKAFSDMGYQLGDFPEAEWIGDNGVHIGCHQYLTTSDIEVIKTALQEMMQCMK